MARQTKEDEVTFETLVDKELIAIGDEITCNNGVGTINQDKELEWKKPKSSKIITSST